MNRIIFMPALAATLLAGCAASSVPFSAALPPTSLAGGPIAPSYPAGELPASSFYQLETYSTNNFSLLYGQNRVIYQGPEVARFVADGISGQREAYYRRVIQDDGFYHQLYDLDDQPLLNCGELAPLQTMGDWVLLGRPDGVEIGTCVSNYFYNLHTGEQKLPGHTEAVKIADELYSVLTVDAVTGISRSKLVDGNLNILQDLAPYACYNIPGNANYLFLSAQVDQTLQEALYEISTGHILKNFINWCGPGRACFEADGSYQVVELSTGQVLLRSDQPLLWYTDHLVAKLLPDDSVELTANGILYTGTFFDAWDGFAQLHLENGDSFLFTSEGKKLGSFVQLGISNLHSLQSGNVVMYLSQNGDANAVLCSSTLNPLTQPGLYDDIFLMYSQTAQEGSPVYFMARHAGRPYQATLFDILDQQGNLLLENVNTVYGHDAYGLALRKGFSHGIMDWQGNWVYKANIFTTFEDEVDDLW